jgi:hypothetical protein
LTDVKPVCSICVSGIDMPTDHTLEEVVAVR